MSENTIINFEEIIKIIKPLWDQGYSISKLQHKLELSPYYLHKIIKSSPENFTQRSRGKVIQTTHNIKLNYKIGNVLQDSRSEANSRTEEAVTKKPLRKPKIRFANN